MCVTNGVEQQLGYYVRFLHLSYHVPQTLAVLYWSRLSGHIGRKPVLLTASFAIATTMLSFGLPRTFLGLLVSRVICGAFNGENGVIKSMMMDMTDATNMLKAYGYIPLPSMLATIIWSVVDRSLDQQTDSLKYPYLLACAVPALCASFVWLVVYFRLKESVSTRASLWEMIKRWLLKYSEEDPTRQHQGRFHLALRSLQRS
ncbi:hypothetical protein BDR03DRAFT_701566 [Suillus americanus]|nr:hypothetical protein BDR03DRAFT_701566 [Suillus americanus]